MKYKILTLAVSAGLLVACGSDNENRVEPQSTPLQAFDGAVRYLDAYIDCGNGLDYIGETGGNGTINIGLVTSHCLTKTRLSVSLNLVRILPALVVHVPQSMKVTVKT